MPAATPRPVTVDQIVARLETRALVADVKAANVSDADVALVVRFHLLAKQAGSELAVDYRALSADQWGRLETLSDLGLV